MLAERTGLRPAWLMGIIGLAVFFAACSWLAPMDARAQEDSSKAAAAADESAASDEPAASTDAEQAADENPADAPAGDAAAGDKPAADEGSPEAAEVGGAPQAAGAEAKSQNSRMLLILAIVAGVFILPVILSHYLSKALRMPDHATRIGVVLFATIASLVATIFGWPPKLGIDLRGGVILIYEVEATEFKEMDKLVSAVSKRVNPGGIKEVTVRPYGEREIEIVIPEADQDELERIQSIVSTTGQLEFRILADRRYRDDKEIIDLAQEPQFRNVRDVTLDEGEEGEEEPSAEAKAAGEKRVVAKWVPMRQSETGQFANSPHYVTRPNKRGDRLEVLVLIDRYNVTGDYLTSATSGIDRVGKPCVNFGFNTRGATRFGQLTSKNLPDPSQPDLHRLLAIILDNELYSAPSIRSRIDDRGEITGSFTTKEVEDLAAVLTAGSLPTTLRKEPTSSLLTGPTLGQDTIHKGIYSMIVATVAVIVFMVVYYQFAGIVANLALLLNVLLIVAFMILFNAAFTLSGLAGLALTVGMAVDANVLIYERMREEIARGATLRMAIRNGFDRATTTIIDANVTTLISAVVLYAIGTDQVKGFAVTLVLGIVMNLFTAITFSRLIFDIAERQRWITRLRMLKILENPSFDFIGKRKLAVTFSLLLIGAGLAGVVARGKGLLDIDFTGGVSVETLFSKEMKIEEIREKVVNLPDVTVQEVSISEEEPHRRFLIITSKSNIDEANPPANGPKNNIEWVEAELKKEFGGELAYNELSFAEIKPVAAAASAAKPAEGETAPAKESAPAEKPAPEKKEGASLRLNDGLLLALADEAENPAKQAAPASDADSATATDEPADAKDTASKDTASKDTASKDTASKDTASKETASNETAKSASTDEPAAPKDQSAAADDEPAEPSAAAKDPYAGGSQVELSFTQGISHDALERKIKAAAAAIAEIGDDVPFDVDNPDYEIGSKRGFKQWTLKIAAPADATKKLLEDVQKSLADEPFFPSSNKVGASVAGNTQLQATYALLASLVMIIVYVWIRFQQVSFGLSSVLALVHDVLVALGALALSFWLAELPFMRALLIEPFKINLPIIAAFLTIIGYSINDTIVIFDRIREIRGKSQEISPELVNLCVNQTLSRTLLTSLTVFLVVVILYVFGGQGIHGFAFTLVVGTISGTYSTIYIATPLLIWMNQTKTEAKSGAGRASREAA